MAGRHVILSLELLMYINATFVSSKEEKCVRGFRVCNRVSETMLRCGRGVRCITVHHPTTIVICQSPSTVVRVGSGAGISINGCKVEVLGKKTGEERTEEILMKKNTEESTEPEEEAQEEATFAFRWSVATPPPCEEKETILDKLISAVAGITVTVITILVIRVVKRRQKVARRRELQDFIYSLDDSSENYFITIPKRPPIKSSYCHGTLAELGLSRNTLIVRERESPENEELDVKNKTLELFYGPFQKNPL
ncbi:Hypothetical predicted protein [Mytilus galloprovincialis]|uniref:Uncharacterized protein n=1 Tax=Mytilus galloprovincialis TaxID=29158 RepID=A0A8B6C1V0_MYTGA|nr:Hypothetical predicted protein [Mytilus galloprovincialis]